jgi:DNA-directed RNA polymerase specialized sigma24 family protein
MDLFSSSETRNDVAKAPSDEPEAVNTSHSSAFQRVVLHAFGLRPAFRDVLLLCDIQECTIAEAAAILDISAAAVCVRLDRARRLLSARLASEA